jgi:tetratricopeptide (TPR) repeat protein
MPQSSSSARNGFDHRSRPNANSRNAEVERDDMQIAKHAEMRFQHGKDLATEGKFTEAIAQLQRASELVNHQNTCYLIELAQTHEQLEELDRAYEKYSQAIQLKPLQVVTLHYRRGLVAAGQSKFELAIEDFGRVVNVFAGSLPAQPEDRKQLANAFYQRGLVHRKRTRVLLAMEDIERAIELDPNLADAFFVMGQLRFDQGAFAEAAQAFERALQIVEAFDDARASRRIYTFYRGLAYLKQQNHAAAIEDFSAVLTPATSEGKSLTDELALNALFCRGQAHQAQHAHQAAIDDFSQVLAVNGTNVEARQFRSESFAANGQLDQSRKDRKDAIDFEPDFALKYFKSAIERFNKSPSHAIRDLTEAIRLRQDVFPEAFYHRGLLRQRIATEIDNAISDFKAALSQQPDHEFARYQLGKTYEMAGKYKLAIDQYTQMLNDGLNKYPFVYAARSRCHRAMGNREQATSDLRKAKKLEAGVL